MNQLTDLPTLKKAPASTRKTMIHALVLFKEFTDNTIPEIVKKYQKRIETKKGLETKVAKFYRWLMNERALSPNTAYIYVTSVKSVLAHYDINLKLKNVKRGENIPDWTPSIAQLSLMYQIGDLREKTILAVASNIPMRIGDFVQLKKKDFNFMLKVKEFPTYFIKKTLKKRSMPCFITEETANLLKTYIKGLRPNNPHLFQGRDEKMLSEDSINRIVKNLVIKTNIDTRNMRVRFHMFRKMFTDIARDVVGLSVDQIKTFLGKKVHGDLTSQYITRELKPSFNRIMERLKPKASWGSTNERLKAVEDNIEIIMKALSTFIQPQIIKKLEKNQVILKKQREEKEAVKKDSRSTSE